MYRYKCNFAIWPQTLQYSTRGLRVWNFSQSISCGLVLPLVQFGIFLCFGSWYFVFCIYNLYETKENMIAPRVIMNHNIFELVMMRNSQSSVLFLIACTCLLFGSLNQVKTKINHSESIGEFGQLIDSHFLFQFVLDSSEFYVYNASRHQRYSCKKITGCYGGAL